MFNGIVELGSFLETKFNIEIPDEEFTANNFKKKNFYFKFNQKTEK